ncbi:MAG: methyltransferase domain-containing protein [Deltaproteobacteria bacterium]|jgi:ubiquinone/menaquinone biosynthesis C-methylase UbiE|nr:methyltransferase domain-containing protein [Deltaproteobacteria bacterium]
MDAKEIVNKIGRYWDDYAPSFDAAHDTEDLRAWGQALKDCLAADGPSTVLDLGTGTGFLVNLAAAQGHFCVGLDISDKMLDIAVKKTAALGHKAVYLKGEVLELPFFENTFDYIISARLLWTLVEPLKTITHWVRFIRPGGKIVSFNRFQEGLGMCQGKDVYEDKNLDQAVALAHAKSSDSLIKLYAEAGLTQAAFTKLPNLTKPEHQKDHDPWYALIGSKPLGAD